MHGLKRGGRTRLDTCNFFILTGTGRWGWRRTILSTYSYFFLILGVAFFERKTTTKTTTELRNGHVKNLRMTGTRPIALAI